MLFVIQPDEQVLCHRHAGAHLQGVMYRARTRDDGGDQEAEILDLNVRNASGNEVS